MPVQLVAFTADHRISGTIPLADDRLSDMLNSVPRIVVRGALVEDLVDGEPAETADLTLAMGSIVAVLVTGRRGSEARRRRTAVRAARVGLTRFVVSGGLHVPSRGTEAPARSGAGGSSDPAIVLAGRDLLVPLTDATITYDRADAPCSESAETILVNRAHVRWIDLDGAAGDGSDDALLTGRDTVYHAAAPKDFTRAI